MSSSWPGSNGSEEVTEMVTDRNGNIYVMALNTRGIAQVDGNFGVSANDQITLASWNCNGTFRWMKNFGTGNIAIGLSLNIDTLGGIYIVGGMSSFSGTAASYFDSDTTLAFGNKSLFLIKYDTAGHFQWLRQPQPDTAGMSSVAHIMARMDVAPNGDIYLYTHLPPGNYSSSYVTTSHGFHILKYDKNGTFISGTPMDISVSSTAGGPELANFANARFARNHNNGKFYIYGQYNLTFGDLAFGSTNISGTGGVDGYPIYLASFSDVGTNIWTKQSSEDGYVLNRYCKPVLDEHGNIYIGGEAAPQAGTAFNGHIFTNSEISYMPVPFVISLDTNGNNRWVSTGTTNNAVNGTTITYSNNKVWLGGAYSDKLTWGSFSLNTDVGVVGGYLPFVASFNAITGTVLSIDTLDASPVFNEATALTIDKNNNAYVGGKFGDELYVDGITINSAGGDYDWFVAKFGSSNCNCDIPTPNYSYSPAGTNTLSFNYTGTTPYTSISWDFGDGSPAATTANPTHAYSTAGNYTVCVTVNNTCGSNTYCMLVNSSGTSSISNIPGFANINIYPNPATQMIHIDHATAGTTLDVLNVTGTNMIQVTLKGNKDMIDVSNLASGMYLLRFTDKDGKQGSTRFVKQ